MATCRFCLGRQEGTQFCWKKNKITNIVNGICLEYEHKFTIAIMESREKAVGSERDASPGPSLTIASKKTFFHPIIDVINLKSEQREHLKEILKKEVA